MTSQIDLFSMVRMPTGDTSSRGTWVAVAAAVALLLGRALLSILLWLLKVLILLAIVGAILAIGFEIGSHWDSVIGASPPAAGGSPQTGPVHD